MGIQVLFLQKFKNVQHYKVDVHKFTENCVRNFEISSAQKLIMLSLIFAESIFNTPKMFEKPLFLVENRLELIPEHFENPFYNAQWPI